MSSVACEGEIEIERDAVLDPSIRFEAPLSRFPLAPHHVFLTGATGLLGAYLLDELLQKTEAVVHCLVRAPDPAAARERLISHLRGHDLWLEAFADRVRAVTGNVSAARMGLAADTFADLARKIDVIYHSAGSTNMAFSYARMKPTNVGGTEEILRFAGTATTKPVHFLSSIAIFYTDIYENGFLKESDTPACRASLKGGYSRSKWVADRLVAEAWKRGLPGSIYRPVRILGHSETGAANDLNDVLPLLLKGCILLGRYPAFDLQITWVPVNYVSSAMVHLAAQEKSWGRAFHFFHPHPVEWRHLMAMLSRAGYPLTEMPWDEWRKYIKRALRNGAISPGNRDFLSTLTLAITAPHFLFYKRPVMDSSHIEQGLRGSGIACPPIDDALVGTYVAGWQKSGFLPRAAG